MIAPCPPSHRRLSTKALTLLVVGALALVPVAPAWAGLESDHDDDSSESNDGKAKAGSSTDAAADNDADRDDDEDFRPQGDSPKQRATAADSTASDRAKASNTFLANLTSKKHQTLAKRLLQRERERAEQMPGFDRRSVGGADAVLVQHFTNIFAAYPDQGESISDHMRQFQTLMRFSTLEEFSQVLNVLDGLIQGEKAERDLSEDDRQALASIHALLEQISDQGAFEPSQRHDKNRARGELADAMRDSLRSMGRGFFDAILGEERPASMQVTQREPVTLGGQNAEVYPMAFNWDRRQGRNVETSDNWNAVYKPEGPLAAAQTDKVGLRNDQGFRSGLRQVAFSRVAQALGKDYARMVPRTDFARMEISQRLSFTGPVESYGIVQERAPGEPVLKQVFEEVKPVDPDYQRFDRALTDAALSVDAIMRRDNSRPEDAASVKQGAEDSVANNQIKREEGGAGGSRIVKLAGEVGSDTFKEAQSQANLVRAMAVAEVLDALCGQVDRNIGNYFITADGHVVLIDNDQGFGLNEDPWTTVGTLPPKPTAMDRELAQALRNTPVEALLASTAGLLTSREQAALKKRFEALKQHIETLEENGKLIPADGWALQSGHFHTQGHYLFEVLATVTRAEVASSSNAK